VEILAIQGSLGAPSRTSALIDLAEEILIGWGHHVHVFDLREHQLPWVDPGQHGDLTGQGDLSVRQLLELAASSDAHIWGSPVYHNSYSGVLKCALDHLAIAQLQDKPVALCGDGGRGGSEQPLDHLRTVARSFHAIAVPAVVTSRTSDFTLHDGRYIVSNDEIAKRIQDLCEQLVRFATLLRDGHLTLPDTVGAPPFASWGDTWP
jgi:NAD(P)H-dependent FMN reductase